MLIVDAAIEIGRRLPVTAGCRRGYVIIHSSLPGIDRCGPDVTLDSGPRLVPGRMRSFTGHDVIFVGQTFRTATFEGAGRCARVTGVNLCRCRNLLALFARRASREVRETGWIQAPGGLRPCLS
jgi:hypothetical protein